MTRRRLGVALMAVVAASCTGGTGADSSTTTEAVVSTTLPPTTTTRPAATTTTLSARELCAAFTSAFLVPLNAISDSMLEIQELAMSASAGAALDPVADGMNVIAANMRGVERDLWEMDPPAPFAATHQLIIEAVVKLHTSYDLAASGVRQERWDIVDSAFAELDAGSALLVATRAALPEDC